MKDKIILIVDDNPINLKLIKVLLTVEGYSVRTAADAKGFLQSLSEFKPDLILMDIQLPDIDGLTLTRDLRSNPLYKDILVIAVTSFAMKGDEERALAAGCNGYIPKPIETLELTKIIEKYFRS